MSDKPKGESMCLNQGRFEDCDSCTACAPDWNAYCQGHLKIGVGFTLPELEARIKAERDEAREAVLAEVFEVVRLGQRVKYDGQWVENRIRALMGQA